MHLSSVIPANDTRESAFGHRKFPHHKQGLNLGPLAPEASAQPLSYLMLSALEKLGNADFVLSIKAQITRKKINLPKLFFVN